MSKLLELDNQHTPVDVFKDNHDMHNKFGFFGEKMTWERLMARLDFLQEELDETRKAANEGDAEGVVDGLTDLVVVAVGTEDLCFVDGGKAWNEVHRANMSKMRGTAPNRPGSGGIDLIKPKGWTPPSHDGNHGILHIILAQRPPEPTKGELQAIIDANPRFSVQVLKMVWEKYVDGTVQKFEYQTVSQMIEKAFLGLRVLNSAIDRYYELGFDDNDRDAVTNYLVATIEFLAHMGAYYAMTYDDTSGETLFVRGEDVVWDCMLIQTRKAGDYQSDESDVTQADYYPNGIRDILYMVHVKLTRVKSVFMKMDKGGKPNHESILDSIKDAINYLSFGVSYVHGKLEGQDTSKNIFNA